jgi:hypothetical protein
MANCRKVKTRTYSVAVSTTPAKICSANPKRVAIYIIGSGAGPAYITHGQSVPYSDGYPVSSTVPLKNDTSTSELWAVMQSSTLTLYIMEDSEE